jgi:hypothetical protein
MGLIGAAVGGLLGATAPRIPIYKWAERGVNFITGNNDDRQRDFAPVWQKLLGQAVGKGLNSSAGERALQAAGHISRLWGAAQGVQKGIKGRSVQRGHGAGSGITEAATLQNQMNALNNERSIHQSIAGAEAKGRLDRQQKAIGAVADIAQRDTAAENDQRRLQYESERDRTMQGKPWQRGLAGAWEGYTSPGP